MPTDYRELPADLLEAFEAAYPPSTDPAVQAEVDALAALFGCAMPPELGRILEVERHPILAPSPAELVAMERPFEALVLRAQELDDCVSLLFPLTGSVYLRKFRGAELLGHVTGVPGQPVMPFVGWRRDKWAYDLPTVLQLAKALRASDAGDDAEVERLVEPIWGRIVETEYTEELFYGIKASGAAERLAATWAESTDLRPELRQWWRHERALFYGFALMGKFRAPEKDAFANDPTPSLANEHLLTNLGLQMSLLWRGWFLPEGDGLERAMAATERSTSLLVKDARRLIAELQGGRTTIGAVDMSEARRQYKAWVDDPEAHRTYKRKQRRAALEQALAPSEHGIAMVRAQWPLDAAVRTEPEASTPEHAWDPETRQLTVTGPDGAHVHTLAEPESASKIDLARNMPKSAVSPSGRRFVCNATVHRPSPGGGGWENAPMLVEYDLDAGAWRMLVDAKDLQWCAVIEDDRWLIHGGQELSLVRDLTTELDSRYTAFVGQPHTFHIPELGLVIAYGSSDLVDGRNPEDPKAPKVRVFAYWRERLACIAAFAVDGVQLAAERADDGGKVDWKLGLVSAGRDVAWELRGLVAGAEAWRRASQDQATEERAKREAFGEITIDRAIEALNTFVGTDYASEYQDGLNAVFAAVLSGLRSDPASVAAAKAASRPLELANLVKGPFGTAMMNADRGPMFMDFALQCTILVPTYADVVVRAAVTSAWQALREA